ncbi:MAG: acyltransferase [Nanoarchaeota archaeon]|nr:acyltransferase [Nanoarchaeota archaeon]
MIVKTKEVLKKLEFGIIEFFVGALMVIGLIGYFGTVPADLDWIDHTVSFILFTYLFYKLNITSILFGKTSKFANLIIIISYFSLFFKDIISYTSLNAFNFKVITFVDKFYLLFRDNLFATNAATFYIGIIGILIISVYLTKKIEVSHPSFLYAIFQKQLKNKLIKFLSIFILLLGFYYFVYNIILEWLEFTIDDPVIATGLVFFIYKIAKHYEKFHPTNFIFKIGDFSSGWYRKFISLFHYKKTLPLAISGLLILHALSDLGVFAYSLIFFKENFYLEFLSGEHKPFLRLFFEDAKYMPSFAVIPLFIVYLLNILSLVIFLIIPIIVWIRMFSQKGLHFKRIDLFFIYSSAIAYMLLPGYIIKPLSEASVRGVDIVSISLLESKSILDNFFPNKSTIIVAVSLISILFGLIIYILSSSQKIRKELYAISVIGGLTFYSIYLYYFFVSLLVYFYDNILMIILTPNFIIGIVLFIFLVLSIIFYIGGYLMFLYEIVMEYHKRKWSDPIDDGLVITIRKMRRIEKRILKPKKAQLIGEVFKYVLVGFVSFAVLIMGYKMVNVVKERACKTEIAKFEIDLRNIDKSLRFGAKELQSYYVPCKADRIYFFDKNKKINPEDFKEIPIIKDTLKSGGNNNVFLVKEGDVRRSFYAGNLEMVYPYHICFVPKFDKISFFIEGAGKSVKVASACDQPECTFIPINISEADSRKIIKEAIEFGCRNCPTDIDKERENIKLTRQNVEMFRKFSFCDGITDVQIIIRPKKGSKVKDFRFYEFIPKTCIDDLNNYLVENIEGNVEIKGDPLIMWQFDDLGKEQKVSYKLNAELDDECRQAIQGLGVAQFVEGQKKEVLITQVKAPNTGPTIGGLSDVSVSGLGLKKNVVSNLWKFVEDRETNPKDIVYTIIEQTKPDLVECSINNEKHMDCEVKQNKQGTSRVTIQVDDLEFRDSASFNVEVSQFCKRHERKGCVGNLVFWFDSCGNQEELHEACESNNICEDGECEKQCTSNVERKCSDGDKLYWFDSCGKKGSLYYNCRDNLARNQCRNAQCCIGNFFCQNP